MKENQYLVFWVGDGGDSESYNVYHSKIYDGPRELAIKKLAMADNLFKTMDELDEGIVNGDVQLKYYDAISLDKLKGK